MVAFEKENQSKSRHNGSVMSAWISSVQFMFVFKFFVCLLLFLFCSYCKTVTINNNEALLFPPNFIRGNCWPFRFSTRRGTNQAALSKLGDFLVKILVTEDFFVKFYLIFTFLKLCGRILTKDCYDAEMLR